MKKQQPTNQLQLELAIEEPTGRKTRRKSTVYISDRARDSAGKFATELDAANSTIERLKMQTNILHTNYNIWLQNAKEQIKQLTLELNQYKN